MKISTDKILRKTGVFYELYTYKTPIIFGSSKLVPRQKPPNNLPTEKNDLDRSIYIQKASYRAKQNLRRLTMGNMYSSPERLKFLTLTFHENLQDYDKAHYEWQKFRQRLSTYAHKKIEYIIVHEKQKRGAIHYHAILFNMPYIEQPTIQKMWGNFVSIKQVNKTMGTFYYVTKYLTKSFEDKNLKGRKRYFQNLPHQPYRTADPQELDLLLSPLSCITPLNISKFDVLNANGDTMQQITKKEYVFTGRA